MTEFDRPSVYDPKRKAATRLARTGLNVCVFCSASDLPEKFARPAERFAELIAEHGHNLVWGGSDVGLMKTVASAAQAGGARIIGMSVDFLQHEARTNADEMTIATDLGERKAGMLERSDVVALLVGGSGTLDEITEVIERKKHNLHNKPIVVLNTDGFYEGLQFQFQRMEDEGMLRTSLDRLVHFSDTPEAAIAYVDGFLPAAQL